MNESTLVPRKDMIDAITYLARNLHKWPDTSPTIIPAGDAVFELGSNFYEDKVEIIGVVGIFTKDQWLARRAELQNKPSWSDAPEWAEWLHQDGYGEWEFSEGKPTPYDGLWLGEPCKRSLRAKAGEVIGDWLDTLEKRPEQDELEPFVSVEDAKLTIMQSDGDVKHFGGIVGRSLPLEEDAATAKQQAITPSKYTKTIHGVSVDVYDVLQAWGVSNPALQHLIKKALQCGKRGHKDNEQDLQDIIDSAIRAKELES